MTQAKWQHTTDPSVECGIAIVENALDKVLVEQAFITPSMEAEVQHALDMLRRAGCNGDILRRLERIAAMMFALTVAKLNGRPNLYASQMLRLRRLVI